MNATAQAAEHLAKARLQAIIAGGAPTPWLINKIRV